MDPVFLQWLVGQAGVGGLAAFALWMLQQSYKDRLNEAEKSNAALARLHETRQMEMERLYQETRTALDNNTRTMAGVSEQLALILAESRQRPARSRSKVAS